MHGGYTDFHSNNTFRIYECLYAEYGEKYSTQTVTHGCGSLALDLDVATPENVLCFSPHGWLNGFSPQRELWGLATRMSFVMSVQNVTQ